MTPRRETIQPQVDLILTGHYQEGPDYNNWRPHGTTSWLLLCTLSGAGSFGTEDGQIRTGPGDLVLYRPGARHVYGTVGERWELLWAHFHPRPHWMESLVWPMAAPGLMTLTLREPVIRQKVIGRLMDAHRMATGALRQRDAFAMAFLEEALLWCSTQNPRTEQGRLDERVQGCLERLCRDLSAPVTLTDLAAEAGLSPSRLSHLFRDQVGTTPQQFQERQRLERARQLLALSGRSIGEIAADVGFENPFYFSLRFKKFIGVSPRDYRRQAVTTPASPPE